MIDETKADEKFLLEQLVLEVISIYKQIDRQRDDIGIVTQWGVGPWLIMKNLSEHGSQSVEEIAKLQHISADYCVQMLRQLENEQLIVKTTTNDIDNYMLAHAGKTARERLRQSFHSYFGEFKDQFNDDELQASIATLSSLRRKIEEKS